MTVTPEMESITANFPHLVALLGPLRGKFTYEPSGVHCEVYQLRDGSHMAVNWTSEHGAWARGDRYRDAIEAAWEAYCEASGDTAWWRAARRLRRFCAAATPGEARRAIHRASGDAVTSTTSWLRITEAGVDAALAAAEGRSA